MSTGAVEMGDLGDSSGLVEEGDRCDDGYRSLTEYHQMFTVGVLNIS